MADGQGLREANDEDQGTGHEMRQLEANGISFVQPSAAGAGAWTHFGGPVCTAESEYVLQARARAEELRSSGGGSGSCPCAGGSDSDGYFDGDDWACAGAALSQQQATAEASGQRGSSSNSSSTSSNGSNATPANCDAVDAFQWLQAQHLLPLCTAVCGRRQRWRATTSTS